MSDVQLNVGTGGAYLGTDQVAGTPNIDYQVIKIGYSVSGSAPTQVSTTNPLPITLADTGANATAIKVDGSAATQPVSGTVTVEQATAANLNATVTGTVNAAQSGVWTVQPGNTANTTAWLVTTPDISNSGSISTLNGTVTLAINGQSTVGVQLQGTFSASFVAEATIDGTNWYGLNFVDVGGGLLGLALSAPNLAQCNVGGFTTFRIRCSSYASGTGVISLKGSARSGVVSLNESLPQGANVIGGVNQGGSWTVTANAGTGTFAISAASLPLPAGAATAAKQPALGTAGTASIDVITVQGIAGAVAIPVSGTFWQTTQPVSGTVTVTQGTAANLNATVTGTVAATQSGTWTVQPGNTPNTAPWLVQDVPATSGGLSIFTLVGAASNNLTLVKGSACGLYNVSAQNLAATPAYLKCFNAASTGAVTPGTTAATCQYMIPGNTAGAGLVLDIGKGLDFSSGLVIMVTGGIALTDNTSVSANNQILTLGYK